MFFANYLKFCGLIIVLCDSAQVELCGGKCGVYSDAFKQKFEIIYDSCKDDEIKLLLSNKA